MNKELMRFMGFGAEVDAVERGECPKCNRIIVISEFSDARSLKEYRISGYCQPCQDQTFKGME
jgi:hypothetical protein